MNPGRFRLVGGLGRGRGVMMGMVQGNVVFWILIGAVAGLGLVWPEDA